MSPLATPWYLEKHISEVQHLDIQDAKWNNCTLSILREDRLHPQVSGNKLRKLKYNVQWAIEEGYEGILSFGGAYSNHIVALAAACKEAGLKSVGLIRGEELALKPLNPSLTFARSQGMELRFIDRTTYKQKDDPYHIKESIAGLDRYWIVPEGGSNDLALTGCTEIWDSIPKEFDLLCVSVGTGGTLAGLVVDRPDNRVMVRGYSALKGLGKDQIALFTDRTDFQITDAYTFGGYAKIDRQLIRFMNDFRQQHGVLLDPVYTAKMFYGIEQDVVKGIIPENTRILAIHTGGLQGIAGMNEQLSKRALPQIETP